MSTNTVQMLSELQIQSPKTEPSTHVHKTRKTYQKVTGDAMSRICSYLRVKINDGSKWTVIHRMKEESIVRNSKNK